MKKLLIFIIGTLTFIACGDLTDQNNDPKRSDTAPAGALLANAEKSLMDYLASSNVNRNIFRLLSQHWTQTTYTDESNYDLDTRNIPQNWWHTMYRDVLKDIRESKKVTAADEALTAEVKQNQLAILEILEVYTWSVLVDTFGDIPYEDALKVTASDDDILLPEYDDAATIYSDLITRLNAALGDLNADEDSWDINDIFYEGNVASWVKLGNSIKLRLGMTLADVNPGLAQPTVESAAPNVLASNDDNPIIDYKAAPPNTNPIWVDLVQSGRKDFVAANTVVNVMTGLNDPRSNFYFTTVDTLIYDAYEDGEPAEGAQVIDIATVFYGGVYGASNNYATYSKPGEMIVKPDFQAVLMDYAEVSFYLAEARARGWVWSGNLDAEDYYDQAITASMQYWGVSDADIADYLAQPEVAYGTAPGTYREKIGLQKWLALYNRGFEAWTEWRRLDAPVLIPPGKPEDDLHIPLRYTYPVSEQNVNTINYAKAAEAIGGDDTQTKLFWDIN